MSHYFYDVFVIERTKLDNDIEQLKKQMSIERLKKEQVW